jgi:hypothetical protein
MSTMQFKMLLMRRIRESQHVVDAQRELHDLCMEHGWEPEASRAAHTMRVHALRMVRFANILEGKAA